MTRVTQYPLHTDVLTQEPNTHAVGFGQATDIVMDSSLSHTHTHTHTVAFPVVLKMTFYLYNYSFSHFAVLLPSFPTFSHLADALIQSDLQ